VALPALCALAFGGAATFNALGETGTDLGKAVAKERVQRKNRALSEKSEIKIPAVRGVDRTADVWKRLVDECIEHGDRLLATDATAARDSYASVLALSAPGRVNAAAADKLVGTFTRIEGVDVEECISWVDKNITDGESRDRIRIAIARSCYQGQDMTGASALLAPLVEGGGPVRDEARELAAACLLVQGERVAAMELLEKIVSESDSQESKASALLMLARIHERAEEYEQAKQACDRLLADCPGSRFARDARRMNERLAPRLK
jgi:tetratricopeptide (TPR) repeat protein